MAQKSNSVEDMKIQTENIEYAGDLKRVDSVDGGDNAPTVIVTEEDVSGWFLRLELELTRLSTGPKDSKGYRQKHSAHPHLGILASDSGQVIVGLRFDLRSPARRCE
jgi:hypothetical protein